MTKNVKTKCKSLVDFVETCLKCMGRCDGYASSVHSKGVFNILKLFV